MLSFSNIARSVILQHRWTHSKVRRCGEWEIRCLRLDALVKWQCNRQGQIETGDWSPHVPCRGTYGEGTKWKLLHRVHSLKYITAKETLPLVSVRTGSRESSSALHAHSCSTRVVAMYIAIVKPMVNYYSTYKRVACRLNALPKLNMCITHRNNTKCGK